MAAEAVDITPQKPIALAGYAALRPPTYERVADPLEANIVILRNGGDSVAFISLDLMYVGAQLRDKILQGISGRIPAERVFLSASHTHFGPPTEQSLPMLGSVAPDYVDFVAQRVVATALTLLDKPFGDVSVEYSQGSASHSINRRSRTFGISRSFPFFGSRIRIKPNAAGPRDDAIRAILVRGDGNKILAVCWSYACHPVAFPNLNAVSAEYPGVVRSMLRSEFGNIPVVFWQGFSGNIGPLVFRGLEGNGAARRQRPSFDALSEKDWKSWSHSLGARVLDVIRGRGNPVDGPISCNVRCLALGELGLASGKEIRLNEIMLGGAVVICGLNAEVAVEYADVLKRLRAPASVIPVSCVGDVFGYLPTSEMVPEGGYEVQGFLARFGLAGRFATDVGAIVEQKLLRPFE